MNWEIYEDDIASARKLLDATAKYCRAVAKKQWKRCPHEHSRMLVISDGIGVEDVLLPLLHTNDTLEYALVEDTGLETPTVLRSPGQDWEIPRISFHEVARQDCSDTAFVLLIDSRKANPRWLEILKVCAQKAALHQDNKILVAMLLPPVRAIPNGVKMLQEREYAFFLEKIAEDHTDAEQFAIQLEGACRQAMTVLSQGSLTCLRFDNIFGNSGASFPGYPLQEMVRQAFAEGEVTLAKEDWLHSLSCMYARDAALCVLAGLTYGKHGHMYNVTQYHVTVAHIKETLSKLFPDKIALKTDGQTYNQQEIIYHDLSALKFFHENTYLAKSMKKFKTALYSAVCSWNALPFDVLCYLTCYEGKLDRLKAIEIDILREIDRICRKHDIQYFLAGGSCLGAIREKRSIPWDDDLDIGMLREDFEKFQKVAPQELSGKYTYSSPKFDPNCHYYFDKVRLSDTYFSTFYSSKFMLDDGVFVDIVVYDQTTKNKLPQKWHIRFVHWMTRFINLRWHGYPVGKGKLAALARWMLPIMNRIPFKWYHDWYDRFVTMYKGKKYSEYVLDGGMHLVNGPFRRDSIKAVEYTSFDGMESVPIPTGYDEYLTFLYGPNYRPLPRLSSRLNAHKIARLDLGKYLFEDSPVQSFRKVDIRGELFESETEGE